MKKYRFGQLSHWTGEWSYCIQEERWWGWKSILISSCKQKCLKLAKKLESLGYLVIYY